MRWESSEFCELYGVGGEGHGTIPDWRLKTYDTSTIEVPYYIQDTPAARANIANLLTKWTKGLGYL